MTVLFTAVGFAAIFIVLAGAVHGARCALRDRWAGK
jgi:hypothetical protein